ncbi:MAG: ribosomal protein S18-alanine N-acetyltransferase [Candidatus Marinimicrobia bacterium]|nr:ribosomal protein S18-alanine N-acetyltransferase [Candidatus Neomarinimicrobiota bacterium]MBL7023475.1 ribosomal protein S18-alanine N-acetyltransferase [Candidatus Neomarinimicrobiota bacterium]MBL7109270.1 ribosomal protein S18-alanine N-acetyltransferase [Candidatus Neomarinimicrobiota bacterium]
MIAKATIEHLDEIIKIENSSFDKPWSLIHFKSDLDKDKISRNWVYLEDNQIIAYVFGWLIENEYHLNNIAVRKDFRGKNIASKLFDFVIADLINLNAETVMLEVSANNLPARKLYESKGFIPVGARKDYYTKGDDAVLYILELKNIGVNK